MNRTPLEVSLRIDWPSCTKPRSAPKSISPFLCVIISRKKRVMGLSPALQDIPREGDGALTSSNASVTHHLLCRNKFAQTNPVLPAPQSRPAPNPKSKRISKARPSSRGPAPPSQSESRQLQQIILNFRLRITSSQSTRMRIIRNK